MQISQINSVNYAPNMQSKGNNKPAFGMNFSLGVKYLIKDNLNHLCPEIVEGIETLSKRNDGFVVREIAMYTEKEEGLLALFLNKIGVRKIEPEKNYALVTSSRDIYTLEDQRVPVLTRNPEEPDFISAAVRYLLDPEKHGFYFGNEVARARDEAARRATIGSLK